MIESSLVPVRESIFFVVRLLFDRFLGSGKVAQEGSKQIVLWKLIQSPAIYNSSYTGALSSKTLLIFEAVAC